MTTTLPPHKLRCQCGNVIGAYEGGVLVVQLAPRGGEKRRIYGPQRIDCEKCGGTWRAPTSQKIERAT